MTKSTVLCDQYAHAVKNLEAVLGETKTEIVRDAAIKRFEIAFDLSWKTVKAWAEEQGVLCASPLACFKEAYRLQLIAYEDVWVDMVALRNKTVHTYGRALAEEVYRELPNALSAFQKLAEALGRQCN